MDEHLIVAIDVCVQKNIHVYESFQKAPEYCYHLRNKASMNKRIENFEPKCIRVSSTCLAKLFHKYIRIYIFADVPENWQRIQYFFFKNFLTHGSISLAILFLQVFRNSFWDETIFETS